MKTLIFVVLAVLMFGCATSYQSKGLMGGYSETQLAPDTFKVSFGGNGYTSGERAQDFTLLRAAELTLQNGYNYFVVINESNTKSISTHTTGGYASTSGRFYRGRYSSSTWFTPPSTYNTARPQSGLAIKCYVDKPSVECFDAAFIRDSLKRKYGDRV